MKDALIIGMGLAGAAVISELQKLGKSFDVYDVYQENTSSMLAAGVLNPVVLKRLNNVWKASQFYKKSIEFYSGNPASTNAFKQQDVFKLIKSLAEENSWYEKQSDPFIGQCFSDLDNYKVNGVEHRGAWFSGTYILDVKKYLSQLRSSLGDNYINEPFAYSELHDKGEGWSYKGELYQHVVSCVGTSAKEDLVGLNSFKGTYLNVTSALNQKTFLKGSHFIVPKGSYFKVGATFSRNIGLEPDPEELNELENFLNQELGLNEFEILDSETGFRPVSKDRRPIVGKTKQGMFALNGLGSRGVLLAPLLAEQLCQQIFNAAEPWPELDPNRFKAS